VNSTLTLIMTSSANRGQLDQRSVSRRRTARSMAAWVLVCCFVGSALLAQQSGKALDALSAVVPDLKSQTTVPILLPQQLPALAEKDYYAHANGDAEGYTIRLESDPDCDGANACFLGMLRAKRGGRFSYPEVVKLGEAATGRFQPTSCGGSCSEQAIQWKYQGVLYTAQLNLHTESEKEARTAMIDLAKSAVRLGPR
jgi:hypothetical protein